MATHDLHPGWNGKLPGVGSPLGVP